MPRVVDADIPPVIIWMLEAPDHSTVDSKAVAEALNGMAIFVNGHRVILSVGERAPELSWFEDKFPLDERNNEPLED